MAHSSPVKLDYVASGCNRVVGALDWADEGLIAYCAHHAIAVYDPSTSSIVSTLLGHTDTVTCLRWFKASDFGLESQTTSSLADQPQTLALASGGGDGSVNLWLLTLQNPSQPWTLAATLPAHKASAVTSITIHNAGSPGQMVLVTTAGDGDVSIWSTLQAIPQPSALVSTTDTEPSSSSQWNLLQRISYGTKIQHCSAITALPFEPKCLLLALGGVDGKVRLLLSSSPSSSSSSAQSNSKGLSEFKLMCELAGHQNWVRGLAFTHLKDSKMLLASASQDRYIRLWAITPESLPPVFSAGTHPDSESTDLTTTKSSHDASVKAQSTNLAASLMKFAPRPRFSSPVSGVTYQATLEALLIGHEDWVHSVAWKPSSNVDDVPCLLSASMDRTMALWIPDKATGIWLSQESVGDAGVNHLGYYTGVWHPNGTSIVAHGFTGALHLWNRTEDDDLIPQPAVGGHCNQVVDACWGVDGGCLLTVSTDQTARLTTKLKNTGKWCEIARPQVHGHDFSCVTALPNRRQDGQQNVDDEEGAGAKESQADRYLYVSGSEEKVLRVFEAPGAFADTLAMARGRPFSFAPSTPAYGASLPALGLSNKAIYTTEDPAGAAGGNNNVSGSAEAGLGEGGFNEYGPDVAPNAAPTAIAGPPLEEHLAGSTLWPEIHKLYGHGNEIYCVTAHPEGRFLASSCRAQSTSTAGILLWDTTTWTLYASLEAAHSLTVTQLAFSPNGNFLASVSRDRSLALFSSSSSCTAAAAAINGGNSSNNNTNNDTKDTFSLVSHVKAHARIVWGVSWAPNSSLLATASRDGTVKFWAIDSITGECIGNSAVTTLSFDKIGVQSVAFAPKELANGKFMVAVGLENGHVVVGILTWRSEEQGSSSTVEWSEVWRTSVVEKHAAAVRRVCWRVADENIDGGEVKDSNFDLASVSDDHSIRIFNVNSSCFI